MFFSKILVQRFPIHFLDNTNVQAEHGNMNLWAASVIKYFNHLDSITLTKQVKVSEYIIL